MAHHYHMLLPAGFYLSGAGFGAFLKARYCACMAAPPILKTISTTSAVASVAYTGVIMVAGIKKRDLMILSTAGIVGGFIPSQWGQMWHVKMSQLSQKIQNKNVHQ